ncbi:MAG TPA: HEAT repeat domain-containing protein [Gemmataceae bacterium]|nr:HEAT repeat domain-containing protein [Gemmataceae bacterium]
MPTPLSTKKPIAMIAESAPKLSPAPGIQPAKVRPAPNLESAAPKVEAPKPVTFSMKRRQNRNEEELRKELMQMAEVALSLQGPRKLRDLGQPAFAIAGLPLRRGAECRLGKEPAENLQLFSQRIRQCIQQNAADTDGLAKKLLADDTSCRRPEAIPAMVQMLQVENQPVRLALIEALSGIEGVQASKALTDRALYDLSPSVRQAAVKALKDRPVEEYRDQLVAGLRYPWSPVADHAAEALAALNVKSAVPELMDMLEKPAREKGAGKTPVIKELVKISHQRNCMLCHPPSFSPSDPVRGALPVPGQSQAPANYSQGQVFVRADVTYLQQDFSVMQPEVHASPGPAFQRYDYVIRSRSATAKDLSQDFRQRGAILFALKELIGKENESWHLHQALFREEENRLHEAEIAFWKAQVEQLAKEKANSKQIQEHSKFDMQENFAIEKPRFNVDSMPWPVVLKEDRKLGSQVRVLAQFLERLDNNQGNGEMAWAIKEALQILQGLRLRLDNYPITDLHANEAKNFLDGIENDLWALKRFI